MLRVRDLELSIEFYTEILGMNLIRTKDYPDGRFTLAFLGYGQESKNTVLELTHNWDKKDYDHGDGYGHLAIGVEDVYRACKKIEIAGGVIVRPPGPMKHGDTVLAFVEDPDGYKIELFSEN
jgi:lactoylglutathione lyase